MNLLGLLTNNMGIASEAANAFLNNNAISPTTQTLTVAALGHGSRLDDRNDDGCVKARRIFHQTAARQRTVTSQARRVETTPRRRRRMAD